MAELDGIEIPDELLDAVTGGAISPARRRSLIDLMRHVKSHDVLKERLIEFFTQNGSADEATHEQLDKEPPRAAPFFARRWLRFRRTVHSQWADDGALPARLPLRAKYDVNTSQNKSCGHCGLRRRRW